MSRNFLIQPLSNLDDIYIFIFYSYQSFYANIAQERQPCLAITKILISISQPCVLDFKTHDCSIGSLLIRDSPKHYTPFKTS